MKKLDYFSLMITIASIFGSTNGYSNVFFPISQFLYYKTFLANRTLPVTVVYMYIYKTLDVFGQIPPLCVSPLIYSPQFLGVLLLVSSLESKAMNQETCGVELNIPGTGLL